MAPVAAFMPGVQVTTGLGFFLHSGSLSGLDRNISNSLSTGFIIALSRIPSGIVIISHAHK